MYSEFDLTQPHNPKRLALAQFALALANLLVAYDVMEADDDVDDLAVHFDGRFKRLDVAHLDAAGHLDRMLLSLAADPNNAETFATPIGLPTQAGGQTH